MTIENASVPLGPTSWAPTGGSATTVKIRSRNGNTLVAYLDEDLSLLQQKTLNFSVKPPKASASAPNGYTQARCAVSLNQPFALDNGETTVNTARAELALDPEATPAERKALRYNLALALLDEDFDEFWDEQSTS
jgi:hypothetical protein